MAVQPYSDNLICRSPELEIIQQMADSLDGVRQSSSNLGMQELECLKALLQNILERARCSQDDCKAIMNSARIVQAYYAGNKTKAVSRRGKGAAPAGPNIQSFLDAARYLFLWFTITGDGHKNALILKTRVDVAIAAVKQFLAAAKRYPQSLGVASFFDVPTAAANVLKKLRSYSKLCDELVVSLESCAGTMEAHKALEQIRHSQEETETSCCALMCEFGHWREWKDACAQDLEISLQKIIFLVRSMRTLVNKLKLDSTCGRHFKELGQTMLRCAKDIQKITESQNPATNEVTGKIVSFAEVIVAQPVDSSLTLEFAHNLRREVEEITPAVETLMCTKCESDGFTSKLYQFSALLFQADCYLDNMATELKEREGEERKHRPHKWDYHLEVPHELLSDGSVVVVREPNTGYIRETLKASSQIVHYDDLPALTFELRTLNGEVLDSETLCHQ